MRGGHDRPPAVTLESVAFDWGDAYLLSCARDRWVALRRDSHRFLTAHTLTGLERAIEADYRDHPAPRDFGPPGAADYLSPARDDPAPDAGHPGRTPATPGTSPRQPRTRGPGPHLVHAPPHPDHLPSLRPHPHLRRIIAGSTRQDLRPMRPPLPR